MNFTEKQKRRTGRELNMKSMSFRGASKSDSHQDVSPFYQNNLTEAIFMNHNSSAHQPPKFLISTRYKSPSQEATLTVSSKAGRLHAASASHLLRGAVMASSVASTIAKRNELRKEEGRREGVK